MIRITFLLLLFSFSSAAQDSATITGQIVDLKTSNPINGAGVRVQLKFSGTFVTSVACDSIGRFSIKACRSLKDEWIVLIYSGPGFITENWTLTGVADINLGITRLERIRHRKEY